MKNNDQSKCPYCGSKDLSIKQARMFPYLKEKVDIHCINCEYICTGTVVNKKTIEKYSHIYEQEIKQMSKAKREFKKYVIKNEVDNKILNYLAELEQQNEEMLKIFFQLHEFGAGVRNGEHLRRILDIEIRMVLEKITGKSIDEVIK